MAENKQPRIIPDGAHHSGLMKDYGGRYNPDFESELSQLRKMLTAASHALRSYQHYNSSPDLAESIADEIDKLLADTEKKSSE